MAPQSLNSTANGCIAFLSIARILAGSSTLLVPQMAGQFFGVPIAIETNVVARLFGVRDLVIGAFLWRARGTILKAIAKGDAAKDIEARRDVRNILWMGLLCDSTDVCSSVVAVLLEGMQGKAIGLIGGGAALFAALGGAALRRM